MDQHRAWRAVADWYHGFFIGLILRTVVQRGANDAAKLVFRTVRTQHHRRFLPGLAKLGLTGLPHAVASTQYYYLSNRIGGVSVEYTPESDRNAGIRFPPPRWVWRGVAICGIPTQVSEAMLRGWQAHNGVRSAIHAWASSAPRWLSMATPGWRATSRNTTTTCPRKSACASSVMRNRHRSTPHALPH